MTHHGVPPPIDLVTHRSARSWLGRAIFLLPVALVLLVICVDTRRVY